MNTDIISRLNDDINNKKNLAVVSIVSSEGSTPRDIGSKMIVYPDKTIYGTIGGGELEHLVIKDAVDCIKKNENKKLVFDLTPSGIDALCMGKVEVLIEVYTWPVRVLILGAGHVALSLSKLLDFLQIPYSVADDRNEFANRDNFLNAADIINDLPHKALKKYPVDENTYIVIVTRGHIYDEKCLRESLNTKACYIGMIGSKSKVKEIFKRLDKEGLYPQRDKRVYSPVGLSLGGKTPNEIAVSIVSEILCVSYKIRPRHMRETVLI
ncbi:MAG: hypothetical protein GX445_06780 [Elusimicrobia bacterium]|nr:hypothetical protein [Elusimicrobiota bacterium]